MSRSWRGAGHSRAVVCCRNCFIPSYPAICVLQGAWCKVKWWQRIVETPAASPPGVVVTSLHQHTIYILISKVLFPIIPGQRPLLAEPASYFSFLSHFSFFDVFICMYSLMR